MYVIRLRAAALALALAVSAFAALGWATWLLLWSEPPTAQVVLPGVHCAGVPLGNLTFEEAQRRLERALAPIYRQHILLECEEKKWLIRPEEAGLKLDLQATLQQAKALGRRRGLLRRWLLAPQLQRSGHDLQVCYTWDRERRDALLSRLRQAVEQEPVSARLEIEEGRPQTVPGRYGRKIETERLLSALRATVLQPTGRRIVIPLAPARPEVTAEEIRSWGIKSLRASFSTRYSPENQARARNIELATAALDGALIPPGEVFSFNRRVGPRSLDRGYKQAPVLVNGQPEPGVGGGVCQLSSTLYNAALLSGLEIAERTPHSAPVPYLPPARDATVVYATIDLLIRNNTAAYILIKARAGEGVLTVEIYGAQPEYQQVELQSELVNEVPLSAGEDSGPNGTAEKADSSRQGIRARLWKITRYADGRVERELVNESYYPPQPSRAEQQTATD